MKKSILIFALTATVASCGSSTNETVVDTVKPVDTIIVDTVKVDTSKVDTVGVQKFIDNHNATK